MVVRLNSELPREPATEALEDASPGNGLARETALRQNAESALARAEERHRALLDAFPDVVLLADRDGTVMAPLETPGQRVAGARFARTFLSDLWPSNVAALVSNAIADALASRQVQTLEFEIATPSGTRHQEARVAAANENNAVVVVRDVTERHTREAENRAALARIEMLDAISQAFAGATLDYGAALDMAVRRASELIGDLCIVVQLTRDEMGLTPLAAHDRDHKVRDLVGRLLASGKLPAREGVLEPVLDLGDTVLSNDLPEKDLLALFAEAPGSAIERLGAHALLAVPMRVSGSITGVLMLLRHRSGRRYREEDVVFAQAIADRAAVAIHAAHLYAENIHQAAALRRVNRDLEQRIAQRTEELARANEALRQQATEDPLTGLANRRQFDATFELELRRARRQNDHLTLLLIDVDFFKPFNDLYGHPRGDACLKQVAQALRNCFRRAGDLPARYGGEEFAVVLPASDAAAAHVVSERFRKAIETLAIPHEGSSVGPCVTVSVGAVSVRVVAATTREALMLSADAALYRSKAEGRNRVTLNDLG